MGKIYHVSRNEFGSGYTVSEDPLSAALENYNGPDVTVPLLLVIVFIITLPLSPIMYWISRHMLKKEQRLEQERSAAMLRRLEEMLESGEDFGKNSPEDAFEIDAIRAQKQNERQQNKLVKFLKFANTVHLILFIGWALLMVFVMICGPFILFKMISSGELTFFN